MSTPEEWGHAFARQAKADFEAWNALQGHEELAPCQKYHFVQMACEKLAKAYLYQHGVDPKDLQSSHAYTAKNLPTIAKQYLSRVAPNERKKWRPFLRQVKLFAREIELLSPAVDDGGRRPDNCEYPWEGNEGKVYVPAEFGFPNLSFLRVRGARTFLKFVEEAIQGLA